MTPPVFGQKPPAPENRPKEPNISELINTSPTCVVRCKTCNGWIMLQIVFFVDPDDRREAMAEIGELVVKGHKPEMLTKEQYQSTDIPMCSCKHEG